MLQKKVKRAIGFGAIVNINDELREIRIKRKKQDQSSKLLSMPYHLRSTKLIVVGGFVSSNNEKYFKVIRLNTNENGYSYIDWNSISIIHSKFVSESDNGIRSFFQTDHLLKANNDEAYKRFKKEFV